MKYRSDVTVLKLFEVCKDRFYRLTEKNQTCDEGVASVGAGNFFSYTVTQRSPENSTPPAFWVLHFP